MAIHVQCVCTCTDACVKDCVTTMCDGPLFLSYCCWQIFIGDICDICDFYPYILNKVHSEYTCTCTL